MADISFPEFTTVLDWGERFDSNAVLRSPMENGLAKQARRFTKVMKRYEMNILMSDAEYSTFLTWWKDSAEHGVKFFDIDDPRTGSTVEARIVQGDFDASHFNDRQNYWSITFVMEVLV